MKAIRHLIIILAPLLVSGVVLAGLTSCQLANELLSTPTPAPRNPWLREWLEKPICQPACFLGITPGVTTITETIQLLSRRSDVQITSDPLGATDGETNELSWFFTTFTLDDGGRIITDEGGTQVSLISIVIGRDQLLTLDEVLNYYGPPDYVNFTDCRGHECEFQLIYVSSGMTLDFFRPAKVDSNNRHSIDISPDLSVTQIYFFPSGEEGYKQAFRYNPDLLPWNGYTIYKER